MSVLRIFDIGLGVYLRSVVIVNTCNKLRGFAYVRTAVLTQNARVIVSSNFQTVILG